MASTQARASWARPGAAGEAGDDAAGRRDPTTGCRGPVKAGTNVTPPLSGTDAASGPSSAAASMMPSPSRSHWMAAPETKAEPSRA